MYSAANHTALRAPGPVVLLSCIILYGALAILGTWPLITHPDHLLPGTPSDNPDLAGCLWMHYYVATSGIGAAFGAATDQLRYPFEEVPFYNYFNFLDGYLSIPFQYLFGRPGYYGIFVIFLLVGAGMAAFFLLRILAPNQLVAGAGGAVYAFNSSVQEAVTNGHLFMLLGMVLVPLYLLALGLVLKRDGLVYPLLAGIGLGAVFLSYWYFGPLVILISLIYVLYAWLVEKDPGCNRAFLGRLAVMLMVFSLLIAPFLLPFVNGVDRADMRSEKVTLRPAVDGNVQSTTIPIDYRVRILIRDSCSLEFPFALHLDSHIEHVWGTSPHLPAVLFICAFLLGVGQLIYGRCKPVGFWLLLIALFYVMCLGPYLKLAGRPILVPVPWSGTESQIALRLPMYFAYQWLPPLSRFLWPSRLMFFLWLAVVCTLGSGLGWAIKSLRLRAPLVLMLMILIIGVAAADLWSHGQFPIPVSPIRIPEFYHALSGRRHAYLIEAPIGSSPGARYYQIIHGQKTTGGETSGGGFVVNDDYLRFIADNRLLSELRNPGRDRTTAANSSVSDADIQSLLGIGFGFVVLHHGSLDQGDPPREGESLLVAIRTLTRQLGSPVYQDEEISVFALSGGSDKPKGRK